jgi:tetratricopeptide (TPR) repeat protein
MLGIMNAVPFRAFRLTFLLLLLGPATVVRAADANQNWVEVRSPHFTVATNGSEKDGRRIAEQFEQIRAMFHTSFATFRVDPAQPILIIAAKNEGTMKLLLPDEWEAKGHIHHAGMYQQGEDKHYVLLQLDAEGNNPFHVVYHEYTHALLHLNFSGLPLWLDEGLAEFFGNSTLGEKESRTGTVDSGTINFLQQNRLLPIETLLQVDHSSPYYNEANRASVFYAESWALVHYLMMSPEARQRQLLSKFIAAWEKSQNQVEAAQQTFGDLKRFGQVLDGYLRQASFMVGVVKMEQTEASKSYAARHLSPAEVLTWRGDFAAHRNRLEQAKPLLEEAIQLEPNLATAREGLGYYYYRQQEYGKADEEIKEAVARGDASFAAAYFHGMLLTRESSLSGLNQEAVDSLKKATQLNPQFAPAFDALAHAYAGSHETQKQAIEAAIAAVKLDPAAHQYTFNLINLLINDDRDGDARYLAQHLVAVANSPGEKQNAENLLNRIQEHEKWTAERKERQKKSLGQGLVPDVQPGSGSSGGADSPPTPEAIPLKSTTTMAIEGKIHEASCSHPPEITLSLDFSGSVLSLHSTDLGQTEITAAKGQSSPGLDACQEWTGRRVKVWFRLSQGKEYIGEITKIYFF